MTTITKTTASAVSRKLRSLSFEPYNYSTMVGCSIWSENGVVYVTNHTYREGTAALELAEAGYIIQNLRQDNAIQFSGRYMEYFIVKGRVEA